MNREISILLIEDDDAHVELFKCCVGAASFRSVEVERASDLSDGLVLARSRNFDVIILDLGLTETQGLDTLVSIMKQEPQAPVVVLTATDDPQLGLDAIRLGAQDFLAKGDLKPRTLARSMRYAMERATLVKKLNKANAALAEFAAAAAHDLKAPLRRIGSYLELVEQEIQGRLSPQARELMGHVHRAATRLGQLVESLLEFSRSGELVHGLQNCRVVDLIDEALRLLSQELAETGAQLRVPESNAPEFHTVVHVDRELMIRVLQNLIDNAIRYVDDVTPQIRISIHDGEDGSVVVAVTDNGIGIDKAYQDSIFEPLVRLSTAQGQEGSGIGLATCRRIVHAHGGRIWIESEEGSGSTFCFSLPVELNSL
ncbi:MAG: ATP-binding protein [Myxococcota bacterium]